jgi:DAACS family dicarboxylate/amino acid:cation (Na+ or H+) symporter
MTENETIENGGLEDSGEQAPKLFGLPLYAWVTIAVVIAVPVGFALRMPGTVCDGWPAWLLKVATLAVGFLELVPTLIIRALTALAAPLVVLAILSAITSNEVRGSQGARMMFYYLVNTLIAMTIGLVLTNMLHPGRGAVLADEARASATSGSAPRLIDRLTSEPKKSIARPEPKTLRQVVLELVPRNIADAFLQNHLAQIVLMTLAVAIGLAQMRDEKSPRTAHALKTLVELLSLGFELLMRVLLWVVALVPIAVFGVVATSLAREGIELFATLGWFIVTVLIGLTLQILWYLIQLGIFARMTPYRFLSGAADVMATTFSTASTAATIPVTLRSLQGKLGVSRESSQLAACVGTNFNNDGTALYQAVAALFFAQALGVEMSLGNQIVIMVTTLLASVGAGGIPSGSFVTMPLIFEAVRLDSSKIPILLTIDWLLDRCRTTSNVLGDMTVAVLLDRTHTSASVATHQPTI